MRLFTAIALPEEVRVDLHERLDVLREVRPDLRWVAPQNLHLTVRFLGECGPREADRQIAHWSARCAAVPPFDVTLRGAGCFPRTWIAKVLYAAVSCDPGSWARLTGGDSTPHVTVARARKPLDLIGAVHELADYASATWRADEVTMYRSFLGGGRPARYVPIESFPLGGAATDVRRR